MAPNGNNNDVKIYRQPANNSSAGTELLHISGAHVFQPSISPDGTRLCYTTSTQASALPSSAAVLAAPLSAPGSFTVIAASGVGDYNCTWSPDGTLIAYTENFAGPAEIIMKNSDGSGIPIPLTNAPTAFDGNPDWAPDGRPRCPNTTVTTDANTPVTFQVDCTDTGPAYERTRVREFKRTDPANGTVTQEFAGDPFTYTPNPNFSGTDSFRVGSFDEFGFGTDTGTVRILVRLRGGGGGGGGATASCGGLSATIVGTAGAEVILGTARRDVIAALGGNDTVRGGRGRDVICGSSGRDRIGGGSGNDRIGGGPGGDRLAGNGGRDRVSGNGGNDAISGGAGGDGLRGNSGRDRLAGGPGGDRLNGGAARDRCVGGGGGDRASSCESRASIP